MNIEIRKAKPTEADDIGYVHYTSWIETYTGHINSEFLATRSAAKSAEIFRSNNCENTIVAVVDEKIVGFCNYGKISGPDSPIRDTSACNTSAHDTSARDTSVCATSTCDASEHDVSEHDIPVLYGEIFGLYVLQQYHHFTIGFKLLGHVKALLAEQGCDKLYLWVLKSNEHAIYFYKRNGFVFDGTEKVQTLITPITEMRYVSPLFDIVFKSITEFERGTLYRQLADAYSFDSKYQEYWDADWKEYDDFFFDNPQIAEKYGLMTVLNGEPIGHITWNPQNAPEFVRIGHNCILTKYKGCGYGKRQLQEAVNRISRYDGLKKIVVETNSKLIAPRNYESVGFKRAASRKNSSASAFAGDYIEYEIILAERP